MRKSRADSSDFNPEKFLAADLKKKGAGSHFVKATHHIPGPNESRVVVLESKLKQRLLVEIENETRGIHDPKLLAIEAGPMAAQVLRRALAEHRLKVGANVFHLLFMDLVQAWAEAFLKKKQNEGKSNPPAGEAKA